MAGIWKKYYLAELGVRLVLVVIFIIMEHLEPFRRHISDEELWLYKNPRTPSYVPTTTLWPIILLIPLGTIILSSLINKDRTDGTQAVLGFSLGLLLCAVITDTVKLIVGRPRPDFFWRCFPDGKSNADMLCTGKHEEIIEGLKSFPSGHTSLSCVSMGFLACYLAGKLQIFSTKGRGESWRLVTSLCPLVLALVIALSRTCDYHHHWQDVLGGALLGLGIGVLVYHQYYPSLTHPHCSKPFSWIVRHDGMLPTKQELNSLDSIKLI